MKVIELLNKIANGEEVPKKIKYKQFLLDYDFKCADYVSEDFLSESSCYLFRSFEQKGSVGYYLNEEVEIIEEDKKIEKLIGKDRGISIDYSMCDIVGKINELIEEIEKLKGKSE